MDSVSNAMKLTLRAMTVCVALGAPAFVQAQEVGTVGGALGGAFSNSASHALKAAQNVIDSARLDNNNAAVPQLESNGKASAPRVMPFIDGGYGRRRPAVGIDFSFDLGQVCSGSRASSYV
ncbi:MAG TPA: hypothetical protein VJS30_15905 [Paraburkholderia sp.]|nr:hypothetical protein [Paraburkholderia sp.]